MREEFQAFVADFESDYDRKPGKFEVWKACAAIKDAEIAKLKKIPMKYKRMEFNAQLQQEIASRDLMIKELREALNNLRLFTLEVDSLKLLSDLATEALAKSEHHNSKALEKMLLEAELSGLRSSVIELAIYREREILAKLAELNKEW